MTLTRWFRGAFLAVFLLLQPVGCSRSYAQNIVNTASVVSNDAARAIDLLQISAENAYYHDQITVLMKAELDGWAREKLTQAIADIRSKWSPLWLAFRDIRKLHDEIVKTLDNSDRTLSDGDIPDLERVQTLTTALKASLDTIKARVSAFQTQGGL